MPAATLRRLAAGVLAAGVFAAAPARAAEIEPRAYMNAPVGMNFVIAGYVYSEGGLSTDPASPLQDANLKINTGLFAYARALDIFGKSGKIDVILPYSDLYGSATFKGDPAERHVSGLNDPRVASRSTSSARPPCRSRSSPPTSRTSSSGRASRSPRPSVSTTPTAW